jgi:hypothetical protein
MEGAKAGVALGRAYPSEADVFTHHPDDIDGRFDLRREIQFPNHSACGATEIKD